MLVSKRDYIKTTHKIENMSNRNIKQHQYARAPAHRVEESQIAAALNDVEVPVFVNGKTVYTPIKGAYNGEDSDWHAYAPLLNGTGLHARPAALFTKLAQKFDCSISVTLEEKKDVRVDGKSILGLLTLEAYTGRTLIIGATNRGRNDARSCIEDLCALVKGCFGES